MFLMSRYFIWDTIDSMLNSTIGFVVHGKSSLFKRMEPELILTDRSLLSGSLPVLICE